MFNGKNTDSDGFLIVNFTRFFGKIGKIKVILFFRSLEYGYEMGLFFRFLVSKCYHCHSYGRQGYAIFVQLFTTLDTNHLPLSMLILF